MPVTVRAGRYLSTCVNLVNFSNIAHGVFVLQLSLMQGLIHSHLVVIVSARRFGIQLEWYTVVWVQLIRLNYGSLNQNQKMGPGVCLKLMKNNNNKTKICRLMSDFLVFFYLIFSTAGTQTSFSLGCGKQGSVCPCVRRVHYQANPSPSVLSTSPKVYSRAGRAAHRKASFFLPSWLEAKGQRYLRLWLLCSFCLAPPIEDRKWAWRELNTAPSRFSSPCGGYSHRKVKLSDKEKQ